MDNSFPIRVVFDAHALAPHRSGIGEYSFQLLRALLNEEAGQVALHVFVPSGIHRVHGEDELLARCADVRDGDLSRPAHLWQLPRLLRAGEYDVLHSPDFFIPLRSPIPIVCTIHDLIPLVHPEFIPKSLKVRLLPVFRAWVGRAIKSSARVITDSAHSRADILRLFRIDAERIDAISLAATVDATGADLPPELSARLRPQRYLLYVGRHDPYKGLGHLLRAFAAVSEEGGLADIQLAIAGRRDARYDIGGEAAELGVADRVVFLDYVPAEHLSALYAHAMGLVFPSLYEGFGLPLLDAMRHGVPVLASNRASLPEVAGDAALLVDPEQPELFARTLKEFVESDTLRRELTQKGFHRCQQFSWKQTAERTIDTYKRAVSREHPL